MADTFALTAENRSALEQSPIGRLALARIQELEERAAVDAAKIALIQEKHEDLCEQIRFIAGKL